MANDTISDTLTKIRNAIALENRFVIIINTGTILAITKVLYEENYIISYEEVLKNEINNYNSPSKIIIKLKYFKGKSKRKSAITMLKRISRPSQRIYNKTDDLQDILGDYGISIVSTSQGIMTNRLARKLSLGGEILCYVW